MEDNRPKYCVEFTKEDGSVVRHEAITMHEIEGWVFANQTAGTGYTNIVIVPTKEA